MLDGVFLRCPDDTLSSIRPRAGETECERRVPGALIASWIMSRAPPCVSARLSASRARTGVADLGVPVPSPGPRWQKTAMASRWTDALADQARSQERLLHHCYGELIEAIADDESLVTRMAFGCLSCYLHGRLKVVLTDGEPPWDGVLADGVGAARVAPPLAAGAAPAPGARQMALSRGRRRVVRRRCARSR